MDIILISKVKHRDSMHAFKPKSNVIESTISQLLRKKNISKSKSMFSPLPVKKIMMAEATHFIRSPLAELVESTFKFSEIFPFVTPNMISFFHNVLSIVSIRFLSHDILFWRQFGVCLFQFRNFLDSFDGVIYRAHAKKTEYKSHYGSLGYFVDAISDTLGGICLVIAMYIYFFKHAPPQIKLTNWFRLTNTNYDEDESISCLNKIKPFLSMTSKAMNAHSTSKTKKIEDEESSFLYNQLKTNEIENDDLNQVLTSSVNNINSMKCGGSSGTASKLVIFICVGLLGVRIGISALFWDSSVHKYQDILDMVPISQLQQNLQASVLSSNLTVSIMILWRVFNALSIQDFLLAAMFVDKTWEFVVKTQVFGWIGLIMLVIITELHVTSVTSIFSIVTSIKS